MTDFALPRIRARSRRRRPRPPWWWLLLLLFVCLATLLVCCGAALVFGVEDMATHGITKFNALVLLGAVCGAWGAARALRYGITVLQVNLTNVLLIAAQSFFVAFLIVYATR